MNSNGWMHKEHRIPWVESSSAQENLGGHSIPNPKCEHNFEGSLSAFLPDSAEFI